MTNQRRKFSAESKAKVALEALKQQKTLTQLAEQYELHPTQITEWKKQAQERMAGLFGDTKGEKQFQENEAQVEKLYAQIGQLKVENDFLKKSWDSVLASTEKSSYRDGTPSIKYQQTM